MADEPQETVLVLDVELTYKQRLFVLAYLGAADFCGLDAARMAKYKGDDNTLTVIASENLRKPNIKSVIQQWLDVHAVSVKETLWRLGKMVRGSDSRDALKAAELILKVHVAMGQVDETKLLGAPDFESWIEALPDRTSEAQETLAQFDETEDTISLPQIAVEPMPVIIDQAPIVEAEVEEPDEPEDEALQYEWDKPDAGRQLTAVEKDVVADYSDKPRKRLFRR